MEVFGWVSGLAKVSLENCLKLAPLPLLICTAQSARQEESKLQARRMWELLKQLEGSQMSFQRFWKKNGAGNADWKPGHTKTLVGLSSCSGHATVPAALICSFQCSRRDSLHTKCSPQPFASVWKWHPVLPICLLI